MVKRFSNPYLFDSKRSIWNYLLWKTGLYDDPDHLPPLPADFSYPASPDFFDPNLPFVLWIGHSTFLIAVDGKLILTDPVWDSHCAPIRLKSFKRRHDPAIDLCDLPKIDYVLISHNHYDHLDAKTVKHLHAFHPEIEWVIPLGLSKWFHARGISRVHELNWWETWDCITAVPAQHFSGRSIWDQNKTFWNGYVFERDGKRFYFTGDTGYNPVNFKMIGECWPHMDLSMIPIGTYVPRKFMQPVHCSPKEAVQIHTEVKSKLSIGMHWKTFCLSDEPMDRPPYDLYLAMSEKKLPYDTFLAVEPKTYVNW